MKLMDSPQKCGFNAKPFIFNHYNIQYTWQCSVEKKKMNQKSPFRFSPIFLIILIREKKP